jgi:hypothetical protein
MVKHPACAVEWPLHRQLKVEKTITNRVYMILRRKTKHMHETRPKLYFAHTVICKQR